MLRKVESQLWQLSEKRSYVAKQMPKQVRRTAADDSGHMDLEKLEAKQDDKRKEYRRKKKNDLKAAEQLERELKNEAKKKKQLELVLFKGRPLMQRAPKSGPKKEQKNDEKPS